MIIKTPDLYMAGFFTCMGVKMTGTDRQGSRVYFLFEVRDLAESDRLRGEWFTGSGMVSGLHYSNAIKNLKSLVHV